VIAEEDLRQAIEMYVADPETDAVYVGAGYWTCLGKVESSLLIEEEPHDASETL
jgi:hypothetical protein